MRSPSNTERAPRDLLGAKILRLLVCGVLGLAVDSAPAFSQQRTVADTLCDSFMRLATSNPDAAVRRSVPRRCAESAAAVAQLIRGGRGRDDPDFLRNLLYVASVSDPTIANAATEILTDRGASTGARLTALT